MTDTTTEQQQQRRDAFAKLLERHQEQPTDYDEGEEEDPRPYLDGREEIARFVCVTTNYSSRGYGKTFFLPTFDDVTAAQARAVKYAHDDLFEEIPTAVVDLDTGATWEPDYNTVSWSKVTP